MPLTSIKVNDQFKNSPTFAVLIYGKQGTGKTILTASAQQHDKLANLAYVDADPGLASIVGDDSKDIIRIDFSVVKDLKDLPRYLKMNYPEVRTVVFDTLSALGSMRLDELQGDREITDFRDYKTLTGNIERIIHNLREAGYNVIFTAGVKDETIPVENAPRLVLRRADLPPSLWTRVAHNVDHVWHTYLSPDQSYNLLFLPMFPAGGGEVFAKSRNEKFNQELKKLQRQNLPNVIQIGKVGDQISKYPNLTTFYDLYLKSLGE